MGAGNLLCFRAQTFQFLDAGMDGMSLRWTRYWWIAVAALVGAVLAALSVDPSHGRAKPPARADHRPIAALYAGVEARQVFRSAARRITWLSLELATYRRENRGEVMLQVAAREHGAWRELARVTRAKGAIINDAYNEFHFEPALEVTPGQQVAVTLTADGDEANAITWYMTPGWSPDGHQLSVNGESQRGGAHLDVGYAASARSWRDEPWRVLMGAALAALLAGLIAAWPSARVAPLRARLARWLDGDGQADAQTPPLFLCFVSAALVIAFKAPDALGNPQFWFEDGVIFFAQQQGHAAPRLFTSYASYLHTVPRLVAWVAHAFPYAYVPTVYNYGAWLLGAGALASLRHLRLAGLPFWVLLASVALMPTNGEVFGTITGLQWLLSFYFMACLARFGRAEPSRAPWLRAWVGLALGLTGPFGAFAALSALGMWLVARLQDRRDAARALDLRWNLELSAIALAGVVQVLCLLYARSPSNVSAAPVDLKSVLRILGLIQLHAYGAELVPRALFRLLLVGLVALSLWCAPERRDRLLLLGLLGFVLLEGVTVVRKFSGEAGLTELGEFGRGDRYYVPIKVLMVWQSCVIAQRLAGSSPWRRALAFTCVLLLPLPLFGHLLQKPAFPDMSWKDQARLADQGQTIDIDTYPPPLRVHLTGRR